LKEGGYNEKHYMGENALGQGEKGLFPIKVKDATRFFGKDWEKEGCTSL